MHYFDSSALVKMMVEEPESSALNAWVEAEHVRAVSSDLARTETIRATALELGNEIDGLVTYDERLTRAARERGIPTITLG